MFVPARIRRAGRAFLASLFALLSHSAQAGLMLHPTRIVFEKNARSAQIELINNGKEAATYRIALVERRMTEDGQFELVAEPLPGELFSSPMLRHAPRQVTLQPGTTQTVRLMLRKPAVLADGEYRSHLHVEKLADAEGSTSIESRSQPAGSIGIVLKALVGASVPVIVRHGVTSASVTLSDLSLQDAGDGQPPLLALRFNRAGNSSVYGDVHAVFIPRGQPAQAIGTVGGVAVYAPNSTRRAVMALSPPAGMPLAGGTLKVTYRHRPEAGGGVIAEASIAVP